MKTVNPQPKQSEGIFSNREIVQHQLKGSGLNVNKQNKSKLVSDRRDTSVDTLNLKSLERIRQKTNSLSRTQPGEVSNDLNMQSIHSFTQEYVKGQTIQLNHKKSANSKTRSGGEHFETPYNESGFLSTAVLANRQVDPTKLIF